MTDLEDAAAQLYAEPPERFIAARDAMAKQLRADGDKTTAADVKRLRKPSKLAAALLGARRADPGAVDALVDAAGALAAGTGGREQAAALRRAVDALADAAPEVEVGSATIALLAIAADPDALAALAAGRLADVPEGGGGFGAFTGPLPVATPEPKTDAEAQDDRDIEGAARRDVDPGWAEAQAIQAREAAARAAAWEEAEAAVWRAQRTVDEATAKLALAEADLAEATRARDALT